jgi:hypothetical protein
LKSARAVCAKRSQKEQPKTVTQNLEFDLPALVHEALIQFALEDDMPLKTLVGLVLCSYVRNRIAKKLSASQYSRPSEKRATPKAPHSN